MAAALDRSAHSDPLGDAFGESVRYVYRVWRRRRVGAAEATSLLALRRDVRERIAILRHAATSEASGHSAYAGLRCALIEYAGLDRDMVALRGGESLRCAAETRKRAHHPGPPPTPRLDPGPRSGELVADRFEVGPLLAELGNLTVYAGSAADGARVLVHFCAPTVDRDALYLGSVFGDRPGASPGPGLAIEWEGDHDDAIAFVTPHAEGYPVARVVGAVSSSSADAVVMMDYLLRGLHRLHADGVAHGAVGPWSVLVSHTGVGRGRVKLLGLGAFPSAGEEARHRDLRGVLWTGACALAGRLVDDDDDAIQAVLKAVPRPCLAAWFRRNLEARTLDASAMRDELRVSRMADESEGEADAERLKELERAMMAAENCIDTWLDRISPPRTASKAPEAPTDIAQAVETACVSLESLDSELGVYLGMVHDLRDRYDHRLRRQGMLAAAGMAICVLLATFTVLDVDWQEVMRPPPKKMSTQPMLGPPSYDE